MAALVMILARVMLLVAVGAEAVAEAEVMVRAPSVLCGTRHARPRIRLVGCGADYSGPFARLLADHAPFSRADRR